MIFIDKSRFEFVRNVTEGYLRRNSENLLGNVEHNKKTDFGYRHFSGKEVA